MKKISSGMLIISSLLLVVDMYYIANNLEMMNILDFLGIVVLFPCILISIIVACVISRLQFVNLKRQSFITGVAGIIVSIIAYVYTDQNIMNIEKIIENSKKVTGSANLSISDIKVSTGVSSYVFIFIIVFVLSMGGNILFNILRERNEINVYK